MKLLPFRTFLLEENNIRNKIIQSEIQPCILFCCFKSLEILFYFFLCVEVGLQVIACIIIFYEKFCFYLIRLCAEYLVQYFIGNKRLAVTLLIKPYPIFTKLNIVYRDTGIETPHETLHGMRRNAPDAEEPENMIDTKCFKIIA